MKKILLITLLCSILSAVCLQAAQSRETSRPDIELSGAAPNSEPIAVGQKRFLVILVQFPDQAFYTADAQTAFSNMMNETAYSRYGAYGSAKDYFYDNSNGIFEPIFDVYGPVTVSQELAYYGDNDENGKDKHPEEAVYEACVLLDNQIDFSRYDNDSNGIVDLAFMYYAGKGETDYKYEDTILPHNWSLSASSLTLVLDGKTVDAYACTSELTSEGTMCGISTACYEFARAMGLPDFYDTDKDANGYSAGLFNFSLMSGGRYLNDGRIPPYLNIVERIMLGWISEEEALEEITAPGSYTLKPVWENKAFKTATDQNGEYFIYEYRDNTGWDSYLPAHGMLVYHVDKSSRKVRTQDFGQILASELWSNWKKTNSINENGGHPCFYIVPAIDQDNLGYGLEYYPDLGYSVFDPSDTGKAQNIPFPGQGNITSFTAKSWNGVESSITLSDISYSGGQVTFNVSVPYNLDYYTILNPKAGVYSVGDNFELGVNQVAGKPYTSIKWYLDGTEVSGTSIPLTTAGTHKIKADITLQDGKRQAVTLEITVQ